MREKTFAFSLLLFIFFNKVISQNHYLDSINLIKFAFYKDVNIDSALFYSEKLEQSSNICKKLEGIAAKSYLFYKQGKYSETETLLINLEKDIDSLMKLSTNDCFISRKIAIYNRLFWIKKNEEKYSEAYKILLKSEKLIFSDANKNQNKYKEELAILLNKAVIKNKLSLHEEAKNLLIETYLNSHNFIPKESKDNYFVIQWKANILNCLGNSYLSLANNNKNTSLLDSSLYYYDKAFEFSKTFKPLHKDSEIIYKIKKVKILIAKKEYNKALKEINEYKSISSGYNYLPNEYFQKAICFHNLKKSKLAIKYAHKLLQTNNDKLKHSQLLSIYDILSNEYNNINKIDSAYKYSKLTLKHFEIAENNKEKTFQLLHENNFEKAKLLNQKIIKEENYKHYILIGSFIIITILVVFLSLFYTKGKQQKKQLIIDDLNHKVAEKQTTKKEYNISKELEKIILNEIEKINNSYLFLNSDFSINTISKKIDTNDTYVSFIFNKHFKASFKQFYTKARLNYAIDKLKEDTTFRKYSIQAIAEEVGYTNASAFTRAFKKQTGITPSIFLKNLHT